MFSVVRDERTLRFASLSQDLRPLLRGAPKYIRVCQTKGFTWN